MPTYQTECHDCGTKDDCRLTFAEYDQVKSGSRKLSCVSCNKEVNLAFAPGSLGFILKEGESGGWASKSIKENAYRKKRSSVMQRRQRDHVHTSKLQPNFNGVETSSWKEAQEAARQEKGDLSASTYDPLVKGA